MPRSSAKPLVFAASVLALLVCRGASAEPSFCDDEAATQSLSLSLGRPSQGSLLGAAALVDSPFARVLPERHAARCLNYAAPRLVRALMRAGALVQGRIPGSPPLGVGDLSRAHGGSIRPYSKSHQSGRDADLAFYAMTSGKPEPLTDLVAFGNDLRAKSSEKLVFDARRNWTLVRGLLEDPEIEVRWLFIAPALAQALLDEAQRQQANEALLSRAAATLHQPSDAPLHDNHLHLRIRCSSEERARGCQD